jgi:hypothetical protein
MQRIGPICLQIKGVKMLTLVVGSLCVGFLNPIGLVAGVHPNARGYNWATLFLGEINTGT